MNIPNFTSLLTALRAFILKSRPAYRDYLGTESVEEKTVLLTGTLSSTGESVTAADGFTGFTNGQTYKATIGEETVEVTAQYGTGSFSECIVIGRSNVAPSDTIPGWMVCVYNGKLLGFGTGDWAGKQIEVATSKMVPVEKWDVKKLPEECLPEKMPEKWAEGLDTGGGVLYVPMELDFSSGTGTVNGVTFEEAQQAYKDGKMLVVVWNKILYPLKGVIEGALYFGLEESILDKKPSAYAIVWAGKQIQCMKSGLGSYQIVPVTVTRNDNIYTGTSSYGFDRVSELAFQGKNLVVAVSSGGHLSDFPSLLPITKVSDTSVNFCSIQGNMVGQLSWTSDSILFTGRKLLDEGEVEPITDTELEAMWNPTHFLTFTSPEPFTLSVANATKNWDGTLEYSTDKYTWTEWDGTTTLNSADNKLYVRGTGNSKICSDSTRSWVLSGTAISCSGNIETLLDHQIVMRGEHPVMASGCFSNMFSGCTSLTVPPELPATTLAYGCYESMFSGCTSLITAPSLPATTLADYCYTEMFTDCTALIRIPELPATTLFKRCYSRMFHNCYAISLSATQNDKYTQEYRIPAAGTGVEGDYSLFNMFAATGGTFNRTPTINTTYYLHKDNSIVPAT